MRLLMRCATERESIASGLRIATSGDRTFLETALPLLEEELHLWEEEMEMENKLAASSTNALSATRRQLCEASLGKMLLLAAQISGRDLETHEALLWKELFREQPAKAVEWAFAQVLKTSKFFPKPADVQEQIEIYQEKRRAESEASEWEEYKRKEREYLASGGEIVSLAEVKARFTELTGKTEILKAMPPAPKERIELNDVQLAARLSERREILRQQKEFLAKRRASEQATEGSEKASA